MLTIGMLSWGAEKTLENTLKSYAYHRFKADQNIILLQEGTREQESMAHYYGFTPITLLSNVGIARGYKYLLDATKHENFLFLENDWQLVENPITQIQFGLTLLNSGDADIIRYRHRTNPGNPLWTRQYEGQEYTKPSHLLDSIHWTDPSKFLEITTRKFKYYQLPFDAPYLQESPYDIVDTLKLESVWYLTTSKYANWTNNPHMARTDFLKHNVYPRLNGYYGDIEKDIQAWWEGSYFRVAQSDGLFTHNRLD